MHRGAHQHDPHRLAPLEQPVELVRVEVADPRPQADERRLRLLGLHPGEMLEHGRDGQRRTLEQMLAGEERPAERATVEDAVRHAPDPTRQTLAAGRS